MNISEWYLDDISWSMFLSRSFIFEHFEFDACICLISSCLLPLPAPTAVNPSSIICVCCSGVVPTLRCIQNPFWQRQQHIFRILSCRYFWLRSRYFNPTYKCSFCPCVESWSFEMQIRSRKGGRRCACEMCPITTPGALGMQMSHSQTRTECGTYRISLNIFEILWIYTILLLSCAFLGQKMKLAVALLIVPSW